MTPELEAIFSGKTVPEVVIVDFGTPENNAKLKAIIERQKDILARKNVNWDRLNRFVIYPFQNGRVVR